jgi:uncharacterized protein YciI
MPQYLYRTQPTRPELWDTGATPLEQPILDEHWAYLNLLVKQGTLILSGVTPNLGARSFGMIMIKAENEQEARQVMENDPMIKHGVFKAEFLPFNVILMSEQNFRT